MITVVIDTNCLLASIPPKNDHYWLYNSFESEAFIWAISNEVLTEYEEQLQLKYSLNTANIVTSILLLAPNTILNEPYFKWQLIEKDTDDNKFVDLAIASNADYLVTNDNDFNILKSLDFPKIKVVTISKFKEIILSK